MDFDLGLDLGRNGTFVHLANHQCSLAGLVTMDLFEQKGPHLADGEEV